MGTRKGTEGSNPSLSANFFLTGPEDIGPGFFVVIAFLYIGNAQDVGIGDRIEGGLRGFCEWRKSGIAVAMPLM